MVSANGARPNGSTFANGGTNGGTAGSVKSSKRPMMHIDDAVRITVDFDPHWPIDKILNHAEDCLKRAESYKAFNRVDLALKEYMKAYITTLEVLPRNKGWATLISDRKGSKTKYTSIMARIEEQSETFERIKEVIKEDNARTGVQPQATQRQTTSEELEPSLQKPNTRQNGSQPPTTQSPPRAKPAVQPKPRSLHGNAIMKQPAGKAGGPSKTQEDLAARFASLRTAARNANDKNSGESLSLATMIPTLPAMPAAIYSPARGTVSSHAAELPTSNQRGMFTRSNSTTSFTKSPPSAGDYFTPIQSYNPPNTSISRARSALPTGDSVTVQALLGLMQAGSRDLQLLIIDVRNREDFDDGHILSQATICIEPDILQRENIPAAQIAERMILAPPSEVRLFEKRHEFDLVIIYDQSSETMPTRPKDPEERAIYALFNALSLYDYDAVHESEPRKPRLLKGGVDAWTNVVGPGSLQTSSTAGNVVSSTSQTATLRTPMIRGLGKRRVSTIQDADEARSWEDHVRSENSALVRTTEDFLRRFPPVSPIQESMTAPIDRPHRTLAAVARVDYSTDFPSPPTRPAPAVPRHSHSGLPDDMDTHHRVRAMTALAQGSSRTPRKRTGLVNPSQWCYANSMLQAMFGSGAFAEEYITDSWSETWKVPMKQREKIQNPQLLSKILANLFHWMQNGAFESMKAKTLMDYVGHIHQKDSALARSRNTAFGGSCQQDSQEFLFFVMEHLHDETNRKRDKTGKLDNNYELPMHSTPEQRLTKTKDHWASYSLYNDSIIDKYWRSQDASRRICKCNHSTMTFATSETYVLTLPKGRETTLEKLLDSNCAEEPIYGYKCDKCNEVDTTTTKKMFGRLPNRLCFVLNRFTNLGTEIDKNNITVKFPTSDLDMGPYTLQGTHGQDSHAQAESGFRGPFTYDLYAVIMQSGSMNRGHYRAYVQDDPTRVKSIEWTLYNDSILSDVKIGGSGDQTNDLYKDKQGATAYILFYQRRGTK